MRITRSFPVAAPALAIDVLCAGVPEISKGKLKDAMNKGAVDVQRGKKHKRLRRAQAEVKVGEILHLHYDPALLSRTVSPAVCIAQEQGFSVWYKPPGMLSQGNEWGDHLSLLRYVELHGQSQQVYLVHRLDREASGLMIVAHQPSIAAQISQLIQKHQINKYYQVLVKGQLSQSLQTQGRIEVPLDGKACTTQFACATAWSGPHTLLNIQLISGRKHQIRRHFATVGHPVMGDPAYGEQNQDLTGLGLQAVALNFTLGKRAHHYELPEQLRRFPGINYLDGFHHRIDTIE